jgi:uncharacterized membrane-anchored protein
VALRGEPRERVLRGIAVTVTAVWVVATVVQVIDPSRQVPSTVNVVMGMIVSALFGAAAVTASRKNGNGDK